MRKLYWYFTAYVRKHGLLVIASVVLASILFSFAIPTLANNLEKRQRQYIGIVGDYNLGRLPDVVKHQISAGLTEVKPDGSVTPLLAERWSVEHEGKTYRFLLKNEIFWQDGKRLEPADIHYQLSDVETIITPNDLVFKLPDAYSPFPSIMAEPIFRETEIDHYVFFSKPSLIGIGPYKITDYTEKSGRLDELVVEGRNERYVYRFYLTEDDAITAFKHGEVDILPDLTKRYDIMDWNAVETTQTLQTNRYQAIFFNIRDPLFNKNIRQALSYALPKPTDETRAIGPIDPESWAYLEGAKGYAYDLDRASERALAEIPPARLDLELTTTSLFEEDAEQVKQAWESFGERAVADCQASEDVEDKAACENLNITVTLKIRNFPDTSDFQLLLIGQESPPDPDQYHLWHSEQSTNFTGYKNTRIDNLLETGRQTFDQQERREIYQEFQQFFLEDAPAIFIKHLYNYRVER